MGEIFYFFFGFFFQFSIFKVTDLIFLHPSSDSRIDDTSLLFLNKAFAFSFIINGTMIVVIMPTHNTGENVEGE